MQLPFLTSRLTALLNCAPMAHNRFAVALHNLSALPRDDSINVLYYDINGPDTHGGDMDEIAAAYVSIRTLLNSSYSGLTIKAYDDGPGFPKEIRNYACVCTGGLCPTEVALCLSYSADDAAAGTPRRRGRIYLPWFAGSNRPPVGHQTALLNFGELLAQVGLAGNTTWKLYSRADAAYKKIESISVDDEWDTQRRRGMRSTLRTRRDVQ